MGKQSTQPESGSDYAELLPRMRQLLEPLAGIAVGRVPYDVLVDLLKDALIEVAEEQLLREDPARRITKSALALKTGIDSRHISARTCEAAEDQDMTHPFSSLLAMWAWDAEWQDEAGRPLELPIYGGGKSFQTLVNRNVGKNVSYSDVMAHLLKSGNIERAGERALRIVDPYFKYGVSELETGRFNFYGNLSRGLAYCIRERLASPEFDPVPNSVLVLVESIPADRLSALAEEMGEILLRHADETGDKMDEYEDNNADGPTYSAGVGNFFWTRRNE